MATGFIRITRTRTGVWVSSLVGEHDLSTAELVDTDLKAMQRSGAGIVLDLSEATFIDAAIVKVIRSHRSDRFALVMPQTGIVTRLIKLVQLDASVQTFDSQPMACREVSPPTERPDVARVAMSDRRST
jgi:anti-anti-sigma regulatory factor